jgi:hypothetical protein
MLRFAEAGQVRVNGGDDRALVSEVDLDLTEVLPLLQQMGGIGMAQGMDVSLLFDAAGVEGDAKGPLQRGVGHRFGGRAGAQTTVTFGGKEQGWMAMSFPLLAQEQQRALGQRDVTVLIALAGTDVQEHALRINVADLQAQPFAQAQTAGIYGAQTDAVIQGRDAGENAAHFASREHDREFELGVGPSQFQFVGPEPFEGFLPEQFDGADGLSAGLAGDLFVGLQMNAILADLFSRDQLGGFSVELAELSDTGVVSLFSAGADGQQLEVIGEGF